MLLVHLEADEIVREEIPYSDDESSDDARANRWHVHDICEKDDETEREDESDNGDRHEIGVAFFEFPVAVVENEAMDSEILYGRADDECHTDREEIPDASRVYL